MKKTNLFLVLLLTFVFFIGCKAKPLVETPPGVVIQSPESKPVAPAMTPLSPSEKLAHDKMVSKLTKVMDSEENAKRILAKLVPVTIKVDESSFPKAHAEWMEKVIAKLVEASDVSNQIFLQQVDPGNPQVKEKLHAGIADLPNTEKLFDIMHGPWDRLNHNKPFYGYLPKLPGAGFYPAELTKEQFASWITKYPGDKKSFQSFFTVIVRNSPTLNINTYDLPPRAIILNAIPYSSYYGEDLAKAAKLLQEAAALSKDKGLSKFLRSRADAFLSNNYHQSDVDWVKVNGPLEIVIGPYETYEDQLMGLKASFEAYITVRVPADTAELQKFIGYLPDWQKNLPVPDEYKNFSIKVPPLVVVDQLYAGGEGRKVPVAAAFALPNDPDAGGIKNIFLKNVSRAKVENCTIPIGRRLLVPEQANLLDFPTYWMFVLGHETAHGLHPAEIMVDGKKTNIRLALKDLYGQIEEERADVVGIWNLLQLVEKKILPAEFAKKIMAVSLALAFRTVRFGLSSAHAKGAIATYNFMRERGVYEAVEFMKFKVNFGKGRAAFKELATKLCMLEFTGDYQGAKDFSDKYAKMSPEMKEAMEKIADIPTDILPQFTIKQQIAKWRASLAKKSDQSHQGVFEQSW